MYLFDLLLQTGVLPDFLKIAKVTPLFETGCAENNRNYRPIYVLPCLSKMLEQVIYNRVYKYLTQNNLLYKK